MHPLEGRLELKLFAERNLPDARELVPVFHGWIQTRRLPGEILIDVADYSHVHHGPGVLLIGHRATYGIDGAEGKPGLLCRQRQSVEGGAAANLHDLFRRAFRAAALLETEPALEGKFRLGNQMRLRVHDRRLAPHEASTWKAVEPELSSYLTGLYGARARLEWCSRTPEPFAVRIELDRPSVQSISALQ